MEALALEGVCAAASVELVPRDDGDVRCVSRAPLRVGQPKTEPALMTAAY